MNNIVGLSNKMVPIEYGKFRQEVLSGETPVNYEISLEMNRIDALIEDPRYYYDPNAINGFIKFCENEMTLTDGSDLYLLPSFKLWAEQLLSWFHFVDKKIYNTSTGRFETQKVKKRLVNIQYLIIPRSNAKTLYASLIHAYFLTIDPATTHQVVVAPTMKQAEETIESIVTAIDRSKGPLFKYLTYGSGGTKSQTASKVKLASTKKGVQNFLTNSIITIRPMRVDKLQGLRSKVATVDEWLSGAVKEDVIGALDQGCRKNDNYVILATSSEGTVRNGVGDTIKMNLMNILVGEHYAPHISIFHYKLDSIQEVGDPSMWKKCCPNIGLTVSYETYQNDVIEAELYPAKRNDILAKRFGIPTEGFSYFFTYQETLLHNKSSYKGLSCSMGCDLSQGDDFCAFTFLFPLGNSTFGIKTRSYVTKRKVDILPEATRFLYSEFEREGTLCIMNDTLLDMAKVYDDLDEFIIHNNYDVMVVGYDPYNAHYFIDRWGRENGSFYLTKVIQGVKTESVPLGELKNLAKDRRLYFDEELMKFAMSNAVAIQDNNGNYKLSKLRSDEKIDNVAALMDAYIAYKRFQEVFE